jgi:hypothetical protein
MQELKATQAREIDKASVTEAESLLVDGALSTDTSKPVMQAGDFYFRSELRERQTSLPPNGFWKRLLHWFFSPQIRNESYLVWSIVISCPFCGLPIMTYFDNHHIISKRPLTVVEPIACPYSASGPDKAHTFHIIEGYITAG